MRIKIAELALSSWRRGRRSRSYGVPPRRPSKDGSSEESFLRSLKFGGDDGSSASSRVEKDERPESFLLQKLKLGLKNPEEPEPIKRVEDDPPLPDSSARDADAIFRKMKETGLIPNAVAMLDGLCKDGLIQDAMNLFGIMREKGTIPDVVVYTAVVEGFCKAGKFDDAKRIFEKMKNKGVPPNAFSYRVLIEGLIGGGRVGDSVEACLEMIGEGHSPTVGTFSELIDQVCRKDGVEEAAIAVRRLRDKGLAIEDRVIREHLDKKGPSNPQLWEAIFGKKIPHKPL